MKLQYYADTDTLSVGLTESFSVTTSEIAPDVTVDFDADGNVVSIDIDLASLKVDLTPLKIEGLSLDKSQIAYKPSNTGKVVNVSYIIRPVRSAASKPFRRSNRERQT